MSRAMLVLYKVLVVRIRPLTEVPQTPLRALLVKMEAACPEASAQSLGTLA